MRVSHVRILPTSLPYVHDQIMAQRDRERAARALDMSADEYRGRSQQYEPDDLDDDRDLSPGSQAATARALKPHSRSLVDLESLKLEPPESLAQVPSQPKKPRKWQFGIRSRNQPYEAMLCLYKALKQQGGVWEIQPADLGTFTPSSRIPRANRLSDSNDTDAETNPEMTNELPNPYQNRYFDLPAGYYIPRDLWFIRARLLKRGVLAPGPTSSTHSSRSDLEEFRRRVSLMGGIINPDDKSASGLAAAAAAAHAGVLFPGPTGTSSGAGSANGGASGGVSGSATAPGSHSSHYLTHHHQHLQYGVWVFLDIQLYQLEAGTFMVDFKCDGYQNVIRIVGDQNAGSDGTEGEWRPISKRIRNKEKEVTSPYPFLDVASDLVAQLAVAS